MAEILGRAQDNKTGSVPKGCFVELMANGGGDGYGLPEWFVLKIPDVPMKDFRAYFKRFERSIDYSVVSHDTVLDVYRLKVFNADVSASGNGGITRADVEAFLNRWRATVVSIAANEVVFDFDVYEAIVSQGFWEPPVESFTFTKVGYDPGTGLYTVSAVYTEGSPTYIENWIERAGGDVTAHTAGTVEFTMDRAIVLGLFKQFVKDMAETVVHKTQFYIQDGVTDAIIAAGGRMTVTKAQLLTYVKNRQDD